ncbi:MAG: NTP transferase domain-containing protein [Calditrichaeota bacterium]|nr:NTP transferase domain-containing protein [Calditrichota bacterium]MCB9391831.1 NTP transferase domain-containing protein [Calditrichota bacterium]
MKAIIPVAGVGSRLRPHTFTRPKVLLNVAGKPILGHILDHLVASGIDRVTLVIGAMGDLIESYVRKHYSIPVDFVVQQEARGLAHAVHLGLKEDDEEVLVILGDTIFEFNLERVLRDVRENAIGVRTVEDPRRFGVVETRDEMVTRLVEKPENPRSNLVIVGIYLVRQAQALKSAIELLFERNLTTRGEFQLTDALQLMIENGTQISTFPVDNWFDCGKPETLLETNRHLLQKANGQLPVREGAVFVPPVFVHPEAVIEHAIIGPYATIGQGAEVRNAMVRDAILGAGARVEEALVAGSLVGNNAVVKGMFHRYNLGDSSEIVEGIGNES